VGLTHICEALQIFPLMQWEQYHSVGHRIDLASEVVGITLFTLGCLLDVLTVRRT
jgi:hypothetical protein